MKTRKENAKTRFLLVFADEFVFLGLPDHKDEIARIGAVEGDPLSYIGVSKEVRQRVKTELEVGHITLEELEAQWVESADRKPLNLKMIKNTTSMFVILLGAREDIKLIDECLYRFWSNDEQQ